MKLGKLRPQFHPKTLRLGNYVSDTLLPSPATKVYREYKVPDAAKQLFGNDQYSDCVWAMMANFIILTTCHTGSVVIPALDQVLEAYAAVTGFNRATGANDSGTVMTDALEYMQTTGMAGRKILGWAQIDYTNMQHRQLGVDLFAATLTGVTFPTTAMDQFNSGESFELDQRSVVDGGHAMLHPGYGRLGDDYATWAKWDQKASAAWSYAYVDEEYIAIIDDWFDHVSGKTPGGLDVDALWADLKSMSK